MTDTEKLITLLKTEKSGFKLIQAEAGKTLQNMTEPECLRLAKLMYDSEAYQARMFATLILGKLAYKYQEAYDFLRTKVIFDPDWRTQEMLARAFDQYCKDRGYEQSLGEIKAWLGAKNAHQCRAASEGLRVWTSRPYFKEHPEVAIGLLSRLKAHESEYARKSVGNALRDILKSHPDLVKQERKGWSLADDNAAFTYKLVVKSDLVSRP